MLLRRLGLALKSHWPRRRVHRRPTAPARSGSITPVATSATLGDKGDPAAMLDFAEHRLRRAVRRRRGRHRVPARPSTSGSADAAARVDRADRPRRAVDAGRGGRDARASSGRGSPTPAARRRRAGRRRSRTTSPTVLGDADDLLTLVAGAPARPARWLERRRARPTPLADAGRDGLPRRRRRGRTSRGDVALLAYVGALSHVRKVGGRGRCSSVELHLWVRELTRIDRERRGVAALPLVRRRRTSLDGADDDGSTRRRPVVPGDLLPTLRPLRLGRRAGARRRQRPRRQRRQRHPPRPRLARGRGSAPCSSRPPRASRPTASTPMPTQIPTSRDLRWFHVAERQVLADAARGRGRAAATARVLPVLTHVGAGRRRRSPQATHCPSCQQQDGIRFLGSADRHPAVGVAVDALRQRRPRPGGEEDAGLHRQRAGRRAPGRLRAEPLAQPHRSASVLREAVGDDRRQPRPARRPGASSRPATTRTGATGCCRPTSPTEGRVRAVLARPSSCQVPAGVRKRVAQAARCSTPPWSSGCSPGSAARSSSPAAVAAEVEAARRPRCSRPHGRRRGGRRAEHCSTASSVTDDAARSAGCAACSSGCATAARSSTSGSASYSTEDGSRYFDLGRPAPLRGHAGLPDSAAAAPGVPAGRRRHAVARQRPCSTRSTAPQSWYAAVDRPRRCGCTPAEGAVAGAAAPQAARRRSTSLTAISTKAGAAGLRAPARARVVVEPVAPTTPCAARRAPAGLRRLPGPACPARPRSSTSSTARPCLVARCPGRLARAAGEPGQLLPPLLRRRARSSGSSRASTPACSTTRSGSRTRTGSRAAQDRPAGAQRAGRHADAGDGHRHRRPVDGDAGLAAAHRGVVPAAGRPRRPPHRQRAQPRLRLRPRRAAAPARRPAVDDQRRRCARRRPTSTPRRSCAASTSPRWPTAWPARADAPHPSIATQAIGTVDAGQLPARARDRAPRTPASTWTRSWRRSRRSLSQAARSARAVGRRRVSRAADQPAARRTCTSSRTGGRSEVETLKHRITAIEASLPDLQERAELPAATDDDKDALRTAKASLRPGPRGSSRDLQGELLDQRARGARDPAQLHAARRHRHPRRHAELDRPGHAGVQVGTGNASTAAPRWRCASSRPAQRSTPVATRSRSTPSTSAPTARRSARGSFCPACGYADAARTATRRRRARGAASRPSPTSASASTSSS